MPSGPLGGPRPLANSKEVFLMFRLDREGTMEPTELELQQGFAEFRGPTVGFMDVMLEELDDGDIILSHELDKGQEISSEQMDVISEMLEDEFDINVRSSFIKIL